MTSRRAVRAGAVAVALAAAAPARAYRPFIGTDAAVAERGVLELEVGYFGLARTAGEDSYSTPQAVINYGAVDRVEAVGEFVVQHPRGARSQVVDAALDLKGVVREGFLQDKPGPSVAAESDLLLPGDADEAHAGFQQVFVLSHRLAGLSVHWNVGGGFERQASLPFGTVGVIVESPSHAGVRAVGELNAADVRGETPDDSGLLGAIWDTGWRDVSLDAAYRRGLTAAAANWSVSAGVALAFATSRSAAPRPR